MNTVKVYADDNGDMYRLIYSDKKTSSLTEHFLSPPSSASALSEFEQCPEYFRRNRVLKQSTGASLARDVGTWVHNVLQAHYEGGDPTKAARDQHDAAVQEGDMTSDDIQKRFVIAMAVAETYPDWAAPRDAKLVYHEDDGSVDAERRMTWRGLVYKKDLLIEVPPGEAREGVWVMDHKVTSRAEAQLVDTASFSHQPLIYTAAAKARGIVYNVIKRSALRLRKGEAWAAYLKRLKQEYQTGAMYSRHWVEIPDAEARAAERVAGTQAMFASVVQTAQRLQALSPDRTVAWPQNAAHCFKFNRPCPFLKYCSGGLTPPESTDGPDLSDTIHQQAEKSE